MLQISGYLPLKPNEASSGKARKPLEDGEKMAKPNKPYTHFFAGPAAVLDRAISLMAQVPLVRPPKRPWRL